MKKIALLILTGIFLVIGCGKEKKEKPSMERYHEIHTKELNLSCSFCHIGTKYAEDALYLNKYKLEMKISTTGNPPGVIDRNVCIGCHKSNSIGPEFYREVEKR